MINIRRDLTNSHNFFLLIDVNSVSRSGGNGLFIHHIVLHADVEVTVSVLFGVILFNRKNIAVLCSRDADRYVFVTLCANVSVVFVCTIGGHNGV